MNKTKSLSSKKAELLEHAKAFNPFNFDHRVHVQIVKKDTLNGGESQ